MVYSFPRSAWVSTRYSAPSSRGILALVSQNVVSPFSSDQMPVSKTITCKIDARFRDQAKVVGNRRRVHCVRLPRRAWERVDSGASIRRQPDESSSGVGTLRTVMVRLVGLTPRSLPFGV